MFIMKIYVHVISYFVLCILAWLAMFYKIYEQLSIWQVL